MPSNDPVSNKVLIGGTGRSGTSVLMAVLSYCGINTGYGKEAYKDLMEVTHRAGFEDCPYNAKVIKQPKSLSECMERYNPIEHYIIPFRNIDQATQSRLNIGQGSGGLTQDHNGYLCEPHEQKDALYWRLGKMFNDLIEHDIPYTVIHFPRFVNDRLYLYEKLKPIFPELNLKELEECYELFVHEKDK